MIEEIEIDYNTQKRAVEVAQMRVDIIKTLTSYGASAPEAAYVFGSILGPVSNEMGNLGHGTSRANRKFLLEVVKKGAKDAMNTIREHEFKTGVVDA